MEIKAYAKINITLDVLRKRPDGYHDLRGVMCAISIFDNVIIEPAEEIRFSCDIPLPENNTAVKAAKLFMQETGKGAEIHLEKHIPSEAGLGGASADAAAVLRGMNELYGCPISEQRLYQLGLMVGADVPFCLMGGCAIAEGVGEVLTPLPTPCLDLVIVKGNSGVSTGALFKSLCLPVEHPDTDGAIAAIRRGDIAALAPLCKNALEPPASALLPEIAEHKKLLIQSGALSAFMTGSGAAVVGIFPNKEAAQQAASALSHLPFACVCHSL
ncbi:MAG: 4-(cytidine 5'-diphospho)-2-C-methyl-D-erythritol kinase [Clostridia bacterium]|nr:4-(cytidine 5'-diphospho)-2-C-methyl-D-erythritol kinase [Clostridia bacterium]